MLAAVSMAASHPSRVAPAGAPSARQLTTTRSIEGLTLAQTVATFDVEPGTPAPEAPAAVPALPRVQSPTLASRAAGDLGTPAGRRRVLSKCVFSPFGLVSQPPAGDCRWTAKHGTAALLAARLTHTGLCTRR